MANARISVPSRAKKGEVVEIKTLVSHPMETGLRKDPDGNAIPRRIIRTVSASFNGQPFFTAKLTAGIAANPILSFFHKPEESGEYAFVWSGDDGLEIKESAKITVA